MVGAHAIKLGTTLETTTNRMIHPDQHTPYNKMVQTLFSTASSTATITPYKDGALGTTESLATFSASGVLQTDETLHNEKYYYAIGTTEELHQLTT